MLVRSSEAHPTSCRHPLGLFHSISSLFLSGPQICVSRCPERFLTYVDMQILNKKDKNYWEYYRQFCKAQARPVEVCVLKFTPGGNSAAVLILRGTAQVCCWKKKKKPRSRKMNVNGVTLVKHKFTWTLKRSYCSWCVTVRTHIKTWDVPGVDCVDRETQRSCYITLYTREIGKTLWSA